MNLSENNLTTLPDDLSNFKNLKILDIRNNNFPNSSFMEIIKSLMTIPNLIDLKLDIETEEQSSIVLTNLPNLLKLNEKLTKIESIEDININNNSKNNSIIINSKNSQEYSNLYVDLNDPEIISISLDNEKPLFTQIYQCINEKIKLLSNSKEKNFFKNFEILLNNEINKINKCIETSQPNYIYATNVLESENNILNFFQRNYLEYLYQKDSISSGIFEIIFKNIFELSKQLINIIKKLKPKIEDFIEKMILIEKGNKFKEIINEKNIIIKRYEDDIKILNNKINMIKNENNIMTEKLLNDAKNIINNNNTLNLISRNSFKNSKKNSMSKSLNNSKKILNNDYNNFNYNSFKNNKSSYKVFTLKMMKDLIYDIYTSKTEFDKSCINNHVPLETLEQYLYTYLNVKYGLKPLIYENIQKILTGIKNFSSIDSEIFLFGKILRNEIEEDSKYFYEILRNNIINILTNFNKNLNSLKSYEEIKNIINQKITGKITYEECREILYKLFEYNDANLLEEKIIEYINQKKENYYNNDSDINIKINRNKLTREEIINNEIQKENKLNNEIDFNYVVKICHEFQIKIREKYLIKFKNVFDKVDIDNNGIINEQEFIVLIKQFGIFNEEEGEIERILNDIDPYGNGKITFSQIIRYFSNERYDKNNSILDKICLDNNNNVNNNIN